MKLPDKGLHAVKPIHYILNDITITIISLFERFLHQCQLMVFHWSLSDSKSPQVSRILRSILADLNNTVVSIVSIRPLISKTSSPFGDCIKSTNYNRYNRHFHIPQFFQFPSKAKVLILLFAIFQFYSVVRCKLSLFCWLL